MNRAAGRYAVSAIVASVVLVVLHGASDRAVPIEVHLALVGGLAVASVVRAVGDRCDVRGWRAPALVAPRRRPPRGPVPDGLGQWIGLVSAATEDGRAATARLAPRLAGMAADRLAAGRGTDADADRAAAEAAIGPVAARLVWPVVAPGRWSAGVPVGDVGAAADALEAL